MGTNGTEGEIEQEYANIQKNTFEESAVNPFVNMRYQNQIDRVPEIFFFYIFMTCKNQANKENISNNSNAKNMLQEYNKILYQRHHTLKEIVDVSVLLFNEENNHIYPIAFEYLETRKLQLEIKTKNGPIVFDPSAFNLETYHSFLCKNTFYTTKELRAIHDLRKKEVEQYYLKKQVPRYNRE